MVVKRQQETFAPVTMGAPSGGAVVAMSRRGSWRPMGPGPRNDREPLSPVRLPMGRGRNSILSPPLWAGSQMTPGSDIS
jgi:hypothetical protein